MAGKSNAALKQKKNKKCFKAEKTKHYFMAEKQKTAFMGFNLSLFSMCWETCGSPPHPATSSLVPPHH